MTTIAVTAASGQLGSAIINALKTKSEADKIIGLARTPEKAAGLDVEVRKGDYNDQETLIQSLQGVDAVLLVSGMDAPDKRIEQHRNVINAAQKSGVQKIVYTSIQGAEEGNNFSPIVQTNRQTEADVRESGLDWVIGRNGIYIEPDIEYIENYKKAGGIFNCAGEGKCGYTTRDELAYAYACLLCEDKHNGQTFNLHGETLSQPQLADYLNLAYGTSLSYLEVSFEEFHEQSVGELGEFIGGVIAGIYQGIKQGAVDNASHFELATGRPHQSWDDFFRTLDAD